MTDLKKPIDEGREKTSLCGFTESDKTAPPVTQPPPPPKYKEAPSPRTEDPPAYREGVRQADEPNDGDSMDVNHKDGEDDPNGVIDMETFSQILDLDDETDERDEQDEQDERNEPRAFSLEMVVAYLEQAVNTLKEMQTILKSSQSGKKLDELKKDLKALSDKGHYLKGSSASLGITKVQLSCQTIQHGGDDDARLKIKTDDEAQIALKGIGDILPTVKRDLTEAASWLGRFYKRNFTLDS